MRPLPNRETIAVLHFWSNDLTSKVQGFWFAEVSYTERASDVKKTFRSFLLERKKRWQRSCCQLNNPSFYFYSPGITQ